MSSPAPTPFSFVSRDPRIGKPPRSDWEAFEHPRLRRFPDPDSLKLGRFLGRGTQGFVFKAKVGDKGPLTVKCVRTTIQPLQVASQNVPDLVKFPEDERPARVAGKYEVIWPLERECINGALLDLITARLRRAKETGEPVHVLPHPKTRQEAILNLKAFSDNSPLGAKHPPPPGFSPFPLDPPELKACIGWAELSGDYIRYAAKRAGSGIGEGNATFFCIVYDFIEGRDLSPQQILETSTFFHTLGFHLEPFNPDNWWGRGVLIDYGDIVPPVGGCWGFNERAYPRQLEWAEEKVYRLERMGLLTGPRSWPVTAFRGRQEAHRSAGGRLGGERDGLAGVAMERERRGTDGGEGETSSEGG